MEKQKSKLWRKGLSGLMIAVLFSVEINSVLAVTNASEEAFLNRGEATEMVVKFFDLERKNAQFLNNCQKYPEECLFSFRSRTNFEQVRTNPVILYPDVYPAYKHYKAINIATELDLVRGYYEEGNSPYRPSNNITKIEALKLVLGASEILKWKDKFEFSLPHQDQENPRNWLVAGQFQDEQWWYGRYIYQAWTNKILADLKDFQTDAPISEEEFQNLLEKANNIKLQQSSVDRYGQADQKAYTSANS